MKFWVNVVPRADVVNGVSGSESRCKRLTKGDRVVFYAPHPEQKFVAIGEVIADGDRRVALLPSSDALLRPMIDSLDFIRDKQQWGWVFRRGFFEIGEADFQRIAVAASAESFLLAAVP